jgi:hypothetical protein
VLYGSPGGLTSTGNQVWTQHSDGARNEPQQGDRYGQFLGRGDFNADGCDELLAGAPGDGTVHVIYGSRDRLVSDRTEEFGGTLPGFVSADFDRDGVEDLAIRRSGPAYDDNRIRILLGNRESGLGGRGFILSEFGMPGLNRDDPSQKRTARVGYALAADEFYGHGRGERGLVALVVGIPSYHVLYKHNLLQIPNAGAIAVFRPIDIDARLSSGTSIIQWSPELYSFEGYLTSLHEVGGLAEPDDNFGEVFSR